MPLAKDDKHYWGPIPIIAHWLTDHVIAPTDRVVDIGCGHCPFPRADIGVDMLDRPILERIWDNQKVTTRPATIKADFTEPLPFADKEFDFVYCRHTIEDMCAPFSLLKEMQRIGKGGYIETPSPIAELTRGIDGYENGDLWRGYHHHRFVVWVDDEAGLNLVSKYPFVEHLQYDEVKLEDALKTGPELWNSYYLWRDEIKWRHWQMPFDFSFAEHYQVMLWEAALTSAQSTDKFCQVINSLTKQAA